MRLIFIYPKMKFYLLYYIICFKKILLITFLFNLYILFYNYKKYLKICICTLGKNENLYIKEFVEFYKNYSVDKIFLYDNNDINGERFEKVINNYIKNSIKKLNLYLFIYIN